jgi:hypothetical protein
VPEALPAVVPPARPPIIDVVEPFAVAIARSLLLPESTTNTLELYDDAAKLYGLLKSAAVPVASVAPAAEPLAPPPASVVTVPSAATARTALFPRSAT